MIISYNRSGDDSGNRIPVFSVTSCYGAVHDHLLRCQYSVSLPNTDCDHSNDVFLNCGESLIYGACALALEQRFFEYGNNLL